MLGPLYFFLMEFVDGVNLRQLLRAGRISPREALAIVPQICDALQFAHDQGIVHRDIKPENILLDRRGRVKAADFGLAKIVASGAPLTPSLSPSDGERVTQPGEGTSILTDAGKVMGTPSYMAPEQAERPADVDHRADIYALGVVFYQMLTGELPGKPLQPPSTKVQVDVRLDEVVLRALEKQPELRYQQASVLKTEVETIAGTPEPSERHVPEIRIPIRLWLKATLAVTALTVLTGFLVWLAMPKRPGGTLTGYVTDSVTGESLAQAAVAVTRSDDAKVLRQANADPNGRYQLRWSEDADLLYWRDGVRHGVDLVFTASAPGYERRSVFLSQIQPTGPYERMFDFRLEAASHTGDGSSNRETERVINDLCLRLRQQGFQFNGLSTSSSGDPPRLVVRFQQLREARPRAGTNLWAPVTGSVVADRQANGTWRVRGQQDLGRVRYTLDPISAAWEQGALPEPLPGRGPAEVADFSNQRLDEDAVRAALAGKPGLKRLDLHDSSVSDEFLAHLADLTSLEHLDLSSTLAATPSKPRITDAGLRHLAPMSRLRVLLLHGLPLTDAGLVHLQSLPRLERLQLGATRVGTGEGLRGLKHLKWLRLDSTPITDEALRHVAALTELEQLYLDGTAVSDMGLRHLTGLPKLRVLNLHGTKVTADGVAALRLALPLVAVGMDGQSSPTSTPRVLAQAPFAVQLPGAELELWAVSRFEPGNTNRTWWRPDGALLDVAIRGLNGWFNAPGRELFELAFRVGEQTNGLPGVVVEGIPGSGTTPGGISGSHGAMQAADTVFLQTLSCDPGLAQTSFRIGVAAGPWQTRRSLDFSSTTSGGSSEGSIMLTVIPGERETSVVCSYEEQQGWQTRLVVRGPKGEIEPVRSEPGQGIGKTWRYAATFATDVVQGAKLLLQRRPYHLVEFRNVSLRPGHRTQSEVGDALSD
jgi:serine/threonine protein kinase